MQVPQNTVIAVADGEKLSLFQNEGNGLNVKLKAIPTAEIDSSTWMAEHPWVGIVLGVVVSGLVHTGKVAARPVVNMGTGGLGAPVVSTAEDGASVGLSLAALFAPMPSP